MDFLTGTSWILAAIIGTSAQLPSGSITMEFNNGRVSGSDGCNRYQSAYEAEGEALRIDANIASTHKQCQSSLLISLAFIEALKAVKHYHRRGDELSLYDLAGEELAVFRRR